MEDTKTAMNIVKQAKERLATLDELLAIDTASSNRFFVEFFSGEKEIRILSLCCNKCEMPNDNTVLVSLMVDSNLDTLSHIRTCDGVRITLLNKNGSVEHTLPLIKIGYYSIYSISELDASSSNPIMITYKLTGELS